MISQNPKVSLLALAVFSALSSNAFAQTNELPAVQVNASADASADGLAPEYAGGQVAKGGRVGLLGTQSNMDTPFNLTSYTSKLIQDQQAASVGEVLLNDPAVRVARGFGNFQQVYLVRGLPIFFGRYVVQRFVWSVATPVHSFGIGGACGSAAWCECISERCRTRWQRLGWRH
ncbi:TonB-dependent receptor plug domain-containing protein [Limnobacter sp. CACIAM 66H1]|uniref:TonB-dependent receptor plug domain-containing protein n=1 Tax=Limnobacter sp. CACIAM 66H1 TaxID=1813033 RepID=UPI0025BD4158|nr:TonB-dependent receptor plug domain-containing protein [Limnobacter sp. CACIAM 66H1]